MLGGAVHVLDEVDSTQSALVRLARSGAPEGTVVTARHQTAGRGRRGHHWWDAPGKSLLCSVLLRPSVPLTRAPELALVAGIAVTDALAAVAVSAQIRWPNDVVVNGRKIAGILSEGLTDAHGRLAYVALGIGINLGQDDFPEDIAARATSLRLVTGRDHEPGAMLDRLLEVLERRYDEWCRGGFAALRQVWRERSSTIGARVRVPGGKHGTAIDVDAHGALLIELGDGGVVRVVSGEIPAYS